MKEIRPAILLFIVFTVICGGIYPAFVTLIGQAAFPKQADGSFTTDKNGAEIASILIGQAFTDAKYFWPRPSATGMFPYNPLASGGSNAGSANAVYLASIADRVRQIRYSGFTGMIPADLVQASASGVDPHITPESALLQVPRVARVRGIDEEKLRKMVLLSVEERQFGFMGAPRINVLALNLKLDGV